MSDGDRAEVLNQADAVPAETRIVSVLVSLLTLGLVDSQLLAPILPEIAAITHASSELGRYLRCAG